MELPDFYDFIRVQLINASPEAMFGSHILTLNPPPCKDFWHFDKHLAYLAKGFPRWINPSGYRAQAKCLTAVKTWHGFVQEYCDNIQCGGDDGYDPKFGAEIMRYRQRMCSKMDAMDVDATNIRRPWLFMGVYFAANSLDIVSRSTRLHLLHRANANSSRAAFWLIYEIFRSNTLLQRVRDTMRASIAPHSAILFTSILPPPITTSYTPHPFDLSVFSSAPLIQSLYAETLRLRSASLVLRSVRDGSVTLGSWVIPKEKVMVMSIYHAHRDQDTWSTGMAEEPHSLDEF